MAIIAIEQMEFFAYHGCFKEESIIGTKFYVHLYFDVDTKKAQVSDNLHDTINYQTVFQLVKKEMEIRSNLLEHIAQRILTSVLSHFPAIESADVKIEKLNPPLGGKMQSVSVELNSKDLS